MLKLALAFALFALSASALAQDRTERIGDWTLEDVGRKPGNDVDRSVTIQKSVPNVELTYRPSESNMGGSLQIRFSDCRGLNLSSGFSLDDPPSDRAKQVREEIHEAFTDFAKDCPAVAARESGLMAGFGPAFAAVEKLMIDRPYVYPKDEEETPAPVNNDKIKVFGTRAQVRAINAAAIACKIEGATIVDGRGDSANFFMPYPADNRASYNCLSAWMARETPNLLLEAVIGGAGS